MNSQIARQLLLKEVQNEFSKAYPFLKIDFTKGKGEKRLPTEGDTNGQVQQGEQNGPAL